MRARRAERTRDEILRASLKVFAHKGFGATTMDDIALELEATRGLLYYHFKTKEDILNAILAKSELTSSVESIVAELKVLPLERALETLVSGALGMMEANQELIRFLHVHALLSTAEAQVVYSKVLKGFYEALAEIIGHFKQTGEVREQVSARDAAQMIIHQVVAYFIMTKVFGPGQPPEPGYVKQLSQILLGGMASGRAQGAGR